MNPIEQRKFEVFATGTMYDTEVEEKLAELGFTDIRVTSIVHQNKLRSLVANQSLSGLGDDCRSVIICLEEYQPYHDELIDACDTDNTLELFDNLAMVLNKHVTEYQANMLLQKLMEDTLADYEKRCKKVCKTKKEYHCR